MTTLHFMSGSSWQLGGSNVVVKIEGTDRDQYRLILGAIVRGAPKVGDKSITIGPIEGGDVTLERTIKEIEK